MKEFLGQKQHINIGKHTNLILSTADSMTNVKKTSSEWNELKNPKFTVRIK
jgi:hypothetical protein